MTTSKTPVYMSLQEFLALKDDTIGFVMRANDIVAVMPFDEIDAYRLDNAESLAEELAHHKAVREAKAKAYIESREAAYDPNLSAGENFIKYYNLR